jgi:hypothetical protein
MPAPVDASSVPDGRRRRLGLRRETTVQMTIADSDALSPTRADGGCSITDNSGIQHRNREGARRSRGPAGPTRHHRLSSGPGGPRRGPHDPDGEPGRAQIQRPPASPALSLVIARRAAIAPPAAPSSLRFGRTCTTTASARSSKSTVSTIMRVSPQARCHTLVFRTPLVSRSRCLQQLENVRSKRGATADRPAQPTDQSGRATLEPTRALLEAPPGRQLMPFNHDYPAHEAAAKGLHRPQVVLLCQLRFCGRTVFDR